MKKQTLHILVFDSDDNFRNKLQNILLSLEPEMPDHDFNVLATGDIDEVKVIMEAVPVELAFMDYIFFNEQAKVLQPVVDHVKIKCHLVLLIPKEIHTNINEILDNADKYENLYLSGHIMKEDYHVELIRVLAKVFIKKAIS